MKALVNNFLEEKINLKTFITLIINNEFISDKSIYKVLDSHPNTDKSSITYLVLYYLKNYTFSQSNDFICFLESIRDEVDNDFNCCVIYHTLDDDIAIFIIDHVYFIINNNKVPTNIILPNELQNKYSFCVNCNHELFFEDKLLLDAYEFYIISNET